MVCSLKDTLLSYERIASQKADQLEEMLQRFNSACDDAGFLPLTGYDLSLLDDIFFLEDQLRRLNQRITYLRSILEIETKRNPRNRRWERAGSKFEKGRRSECSDQEIEKKRRQKRRIEEETMLLDARDALADLYDQYDHSAHFADSSEASFA